MGKLGHLLHLPRSPSLSSFPVWPPHTREPQTEYYFPLGPFSSHALSGFLSLDPGVLGSPALRLPRPLLLLNSFTVLSFLVPPADGASQPAAVWKWMTVCTDTCGCHCWRGGCFWHLVGRKLRMLPDRHPEPHTTGLSLKRQLSGLTQWC